MQPISGVGTLSPWEPGIFSLTIYGILVLVFIASQLFLGGLVGRKETEHRKIATL